MPATDPIGRMATSCVTWKKGHPLSGWPLLEFGAPGEIRTPDRSVRSRVLYPAELRAHGHILIFPLEHCPFSRAAHYRVGLRNCQLDNWRATG